MAVRRKWALLLLQVLFCWSLSAASYRVRRQGFTLGQQDVDACVTPFGGPGRCVSINLCPQILAILSARPIPSNQFEFLRRSICRRDAVGRSMYCCVVRNSGSVSFGGFPPPPSSTPAPTQPPTPAPTQPPTPAPTQPQSPPQTQPPTLPPTESPSQPPTDAGTLGSNPFVLSTTPNIIVDTTMMVPVTDSGETMGGSSTSSEAPEGIVPRFANCGNSDVVLPRIVGGRFVNKGDWPWVAVLGYANGRGNISFSCGAALITRRHVLTAAHCVDGQPSLRVVRLGEHDLSITTEVAHEDYNITKRIVHEDYNSNFRNDIAILELSRDVVFKKHISPICLPKPENFPNTNLNQTKPFVAGWGSIQYNDRSSNILRDVSIPIVNGDECMESYKRFKTVTVDERILCAGLKEGGKDACQGDSGGPLIYPYQPTVRDKSKYFLVGVVSLGFRCAEAGYPGIYSRVTYYLPWILDKLNTVA